MLKLLLIFIVILPLVVALASRLSLLTRADALLLALFFVICGVFSYARGAMRDMARPRWRDLGKSDLLAAVFFLPACAISWFTMFQATGISESRVVVVALVAVIFHVAFVGDVFLRIPAEFGRLRSLLAGEKTERDWKFEYDYRRHLMRCKGESREVRMMRARKAAAIRKRSRESPTRLQLLVQRILDDFSDTSAWLSATLASAGLFPAVAGVVPVGLAATLFVMSPVATIPLIGSIHRRLHAWSSS